jgi:peptide/nickel transport system permease protein
VLVEMLYGTRISMTVGFIAVGIYLAIGIVLGALAGFFGGKTDMLISRVIEVVMLFPSLFLILTLVALIGRSVYIIMVVIGITGWPSIARLVRGEVLKQRAIEYTLAARALGSSSLRIVFRHILPNALSPVLVAAPFGIAAAIITEATLSLLGFGVEPPTPSWGSLLQQAHGNYHYWWLIVVPSTGIFLAVTLLNLVGSGLRDAMDPKLRM